MTKPTEEAGGLGPEDDAPFNLAVASQNVKVAQIIPILFDGRCRVLEERLPEPVDWHDDIKWQYFLYIRGDSYRPMNLFPEAGEEMVHSPSGRFTYGNDPIPRHMVLECWVGNRSGFFLFDKEVRVPTLMEGSTLWMSQTPFEVFSLRPGLRHAGRHTVVVGLGLGHLLVQVSKIDVVEKITLVEVSQELVDWLLPRITPHMGKVELDVRVGDVHDVLPSIQADTVLLDHFQSYGSNGEERDLLRGKCPGIQRWWAWGSARVRE